MISNEYNYFSVIYICGCFFLAPQKCTITTLIVIYIKVAFMGQDKVGAPHKVFPTSFCESFKIMISRKECKD